jgi:hypothetical protein
MSKDENFSKTARNGEPWVKEVWFAGCHADVYVMSFPHNLQCLTFHACDTGAAGTVPTGHSNLVIFLFFGCGMKLPWLAWN